MGWVLLAVAAAVAGAMAVWRGGHVRRHSAAVVYSQRSRLERRERPHRHVVHYRASGALPRWDP